MQQYEVPKFLNVQDKILGPLTFFQVVLFLAVFGFLFIMFIFLKFLFWVMLALPLIIIVLLLSFYKINGRPFLAFNSAMFHYISNPQTFIWKKEAEKMNLEKLGQSDFSAPRIHFKAASSELPKVPADNGRSMDKLLEIAEMLNI